MIENLKLKTWFIKSPTIIRVEQPVQILYHN